MSSEREDAIQQISQPLIELFGDAHQPTECNCIAEVAEQVADWHLAQLQAAKAEARKLTHTDLETLLERMDDEGAADGWVGDELRALIGRHLPEDHPDYWKYHCVTCGLWFNADGSTEPDQEGYCQCE